MARNPLDLIERWSAEVLGIIGKILPLFNSVIEYARLMRNYTVSSLHFLPVPVPSWLSSNLAFHSSDA